jgi:uncharacterized protein YjbJ (UPF0337 family)
MHKDEVRGGAKQVRGAVKDAVGKATGDRKLQADGKADKVEGKIQEGFGKAKDALRDALKQ